MKNITIKKVNGESNEFYLSIGKIVLSKEGIKYFDNYPVLTSKDHLWYIAYDDENNVKSFASIVKKKSTYSIEDSYIHDNESFKKIGKVILQDFQDSEYKSASATGKIEHSNIWKSLGGTINKKTKKWITVRFEK